MPITSIPSVLTMMHMNWCTSRHNDVETVDNNVTDMVSSIVCDFKMNIKLLKALTHQSAVLKDKKVNVH
jgi:hypothetical protein